MRLGVLADVHANLDALRAVLAELDTCGGVDRLLVAGDLVGYGPYPNECVELLAARDATCVAGNHDLIAIGDLDDRRCIVPAQLSLRWTRDVLRADVREYLARLPRVARAPGGIVMAHGSLRDPEAYVPGGERARAVLDELRRADPRDGVLVLGHTHRPLAFALSSGERRRRHRVTLPHDDVVLLNPGAVGQSREQRVRARAMIIDTDRREARFIAVRYDVQACRDALVARGLPDGTYHLRPSLARSAYRSAPAFLRRR